ncbi:MAG: GldG family protein [Oscillospiraceae bacterium]
MENKEKKSLLDKMKSNKFKHGSLATLFTVVFIVVIILLNVVVSALTDRFPSMNMDLTAEKLNSLSETSVETAKNVQNDTEIYVIGSEDAVKNNQIMVKYNLQYNQVANLAEKMCEANSKISLKYVDPDLDPAFIAEYPNERLSTGMVLVKTEKRYKVLGVSDLFSLQQNQQDGSVKKFSKVDGALSNAVHLVNLDKVPLVAVATGHEEMLSTDNRAAFDQLLKDNAFEVQEFNLMTEEIPAEAQMLLLATPSTDYTKEEIGKMQAFLADTTAQLTRSLFVTCHPTQSALPNLAAFLEEWGVKVNKGVVFESDATKALSNNPGYFFANSTDKIFKDTTYENLIAAASSPLELTFTSNNDISTYALVESSDTAYVSLDEQLVENPETAKQILATLSQKFTTIDNNPVKSNVIVLGNTVSLLGDFIGGNSFGNRQYVLDLVKYATGTTDLNLGLSVGETETSVRDITAPAAVIHFVGLIFFTVLLPVCILLAGLVIFLRRRHL